MHVELHHTIDELQSAAKREKSARVALRIRGVILARQGYTAPEVALLLGSARRAVQQWVRWYNDEGLKGLPDGPRPGYPKKLSPAQERELCAGWRPARPGMARCAPTAARRCTSTSQSYFGVKLSLSAAYETLHRLGYEPLRPRPRHRKADPKAQEEFKQSAPLLWNNSGAKSRGRSSRSGGRTRRGWVSRAR